MSRRFGVRSCGDVARASSLATGARDGMNSLINGTSDIV